MRLQAESGTIRVFARAGHAAAPGDPNPMSLTLRLPQAQLLARHLLLVLLVASPVAALAQSSPAISPIVAFSGSQPSGAPVRGPDGALYGTTAVVTAVTGGLIYRAAADGSAIRTLYQIQISEGLNPVAGLLLGSDGLLYGVTSSGTALEANTGGTVFRIAPDGSGFTIIHRFKSFAVSNTSGAPINEGGANPESELVEGNDGRLYGVTRTGGPNGTGVVYSLSRDGTAFSVLHNFGPITSASTVTVPRNDDGMSPIGPLVAGADNYFYGTASGGGALGNGTVFRVRFDGTGFETLFVFPELVANPDGLPTNADGASPVAGLTDGGDGRLYGVANLGGEEGNGTVFAIDPVTRVFTALHDFDGTAGARPTGELLLAQNGSLLGTTTTGGTSSAGVVTTFGTIFSIARDGTGFTSLRSFEGSNGSSPTGRMLQLDASTYVGLAAGGGRCGQGVLYQFSLTGATVDGITNCGQRRNSGGGGTAPLLLLLIGSLGLMRRLRSA
jgi:uncharacterized repeat protein (TIGR03803 family)